MCKLNSLAVPQKTSGSRFHLILKVAFERIGQGARCAPDRTFVGCVKPC
ncbi:MAG: hypothetical protein ACR2HE_13535 [Casimicrobiaceae bacterium]